jgi:molecular chaperone DnaJ
MRNISIIILCIIFTAFLQNASGQSDKPVKEIQMELVVTDEQKIILFAGFTIAVLVIFMYLARDIILRKKTTYDFEEFDSKKDKTYEKYHSDWSDDFEDFGFRKNSKEEKEFRSEFQNKTMPDYYKILGLPQNATNEEIKNQYRELAKKVHPDKSKEEGSEEIMVQINKAYEILSNEELRKKYDMYLGKN